MQGFARILPAWPLCTDGFKYGVYREKREGAMRRTHIAPNPEGWAAYLVFDVDRSDGATSWIDAGLPPPNFVVFNPPGSRGRDGKPNEGRAHIFYRLRGWVRLGKGDSAERFLYAVRGAYTKALGADPDYAGRLAKNPLHGSYAVHAPRTEAYDLKELAMWVELERPVSRRTALESDLGRNVTLFNRLRMWAYGVVGECRVKESFDSWCESPMCQYRVRPARREKHKGHIG